MSRLQPLLVWGRYGQEGSRDLHTKRTAPVFAYMQTKTHIFRWTLLLWSVSEFRLNVPPSQTKHASVKIKSKGKQPVLV